jgi:hypothetical protein
MLLHTYQVLLSKCLSLTYGGNINDFEVRIDAALCDWSVMSTPLFRCISAEYMRTVPRRRMQPASFCSQVYGSPDVLADQVLDRQCVRRSEQVERQMGTSCGYGEISCEWRRGGGRTRD